MKHVHILQYSKLVLVGIVPYTPTFTKLYHWLNRWAAILNWLRQALWVQNILNVGIELPNFHWDLSTFCSRGINFYRFLISVSFSPNLCVCFTCWDVRVEVHELVPNCKINAVASWGDNCQTFFWQLRKKWDIKCLFSSCSSS